jgi:hypothetical protein
MCRKRKGTVKRAAWSNARTALALVLDLGDGAALAPVDSVGEPLAGAGQVPGAPGLSRRRGVAAEVAEAAAAELVEREVGEGGEAEAEAVEPGVGLRVVRVHVPEVVAEGLQPPTVVIAVVVLAHQKYLAVAAERPPPVLCLPRLVQPPHLLVGPLPRRRDDGVRVGCGARRGQCRDESERAGSGSGRRGRQIRRRAADPEAGSPLSLPLSLSPSPLSLSLLSPSPLSGGGGGVRRMGPVVVLSVFVWPVCIYKNWNRY